MKHEFKPGDLAVIVGAMTAGGEHNIGKAVTLIQRVEFRETVRVFGVLYYAEFGAGWVVAGDGLISRRIDRETGLDFFEARPRCFPLERFLIPLRGDENPDARLATSAQRQAVTA